MVQVGFSNGVVTLNLGPEVKLTHKVTQRVRETLQRLIVDIQPERVLVVAKCADWEDSCYWPLLVLMVAQGVASDNGSLPSAIVMDQDAIDRCELTRMTMCSLFLTEEEAHAAPSWKVPQPPQKKAPVVEPLKPTSVCPHCGQPRAS